MHESPSPPGLTVFSGSSRKCPQNSSQQSPRDKFLSVSADLADRRRWPSDWTDSAVSEQPRPLAACSADLPHNLALSAQSSCRRPALGIRFVHWDASQQNSCYHKIFTRSCNCAKDRHRLGLPVDAGQAFDAVEAAAPGLWCQARSRRQTNSRQHRATAHGYRAMGRRPPKKIRPSVSQKVKWTTYALFPVGFVRARSGPA